MGNGPVQATAEQAGSVRLVEDAAAALLRGASVFVPAPFGAILAVALGPVGADVYTVIASALSGELDGLLETDACREMARSAMKAIDAAAAAKGAPGEVATNLGNNVAVALAAFAAAVARYAAFANAVESARTAGDSNRVARAVAERAKAVKAVHALAANVALVTAGQEATAVAFPQGPTTVPPAG